MRRDCVAVLIAVLGCAGVRPANAAPNAQSAEQEVRAQEAAQVRAILAGDVRALEELWGATLHVNAPDNTVHDKQSLFGVMKAGVLSYSAFEQAIDYIGLQGDVVIVMGQETVIPSQGKRSGEKVRRRFTDVWMKQKGAWVQIARQDTVIPDG